MGVLGFQQKTLEAQTLLTLTSVQTGVQVAVASGQARKKDIGICSAVFRASVSALSVGPMPPPIWERSRPSLFSMGSASLSPTLKWRSRRNERARHPSQRDESNHAGDLGIYPPLCRGCSSLPNCAVGYQTGMGRQLCARAPCGAGDPPQGATQALPDPH